MKQTCSQNNYHMVRSERALLEICCIISLDLVTILFDSGVDMIEPLRCGLGVITEPQVCKLGNLFVNLMIMNGCAE